MEATGKRVVGYVRVSVDNENKVSPEMQADAIEAQCALKGWQLVDMIVERGRSAGEGKKRPGLDRARKMIRTGKATGLVVWKIDRCSRSVRDFAEIVSELRRHDADFVSVTESFDTSNAIGRAMLQITMVFAELERERSSERITAWATYRAKQGKQPNSAPLGYYRERDENGRQVGPLLVDEAAAAVVKQATEILLDTGSAVEVQRFLKAAGHSKYLTAVRQLLRSPTLAGVRLVDDVLIPGEWPAIIDVETHKAVLDTLAARQRRRGRPNSPRRLLSSLTFCARDGLPLGAGANDRKSGRERYQCTWHSTKLRDGPGCCLGIFGDNLEAHVEAKVLAFITPEDWRRMRAGRQSAAAPVFVDTVALEAKLAKLAEDWAHERITQGEWDAARAALLNRIAEQPGDVDDEVDLPDVTNLHKAWPKMAIAAKRLVIAAVVDRIVVEPAELAKGRPNGWTPTEDRVRIIWR